MLTTAHRLGRPAQRLTRCGKTVELPLHSRGVVFYPRTWARSMPSFTAGRVAPMVSPLIRHISGKAGRPPLVPPSDTEIEELVATLSPLEKKTLAIFYTGAMSYGSISYETHTDIAEACNRIAYALQGRDYRRQPLSSLERKGPMSNSGEGGELSTRDKTLWQSRVRQVASGRFGVSGAYLANAAELQIKVSQGAKPGIGGELGKAKVTPEIASARITSPGVRLVSPPPHHDVYSIEDLKQLIYDLRSANPKAPVSVKLAASAGIDVIAAGVAKAGAANISIAGPGGTGATPTSAKYHFVHDWETSISLVHQMLVKEGLRDSVTLTVSGGLQTGLDCFKALLLGADTIEVGTLPLIALGCTMAEVCHKGTCPVGIATTNQALIDAKYKGKPIQLARILVALAQSLSRLLARYGFNDPSEAVGRTDLLQIRPYCPLTGLEKLLEPAENPYRAFGRIAPLNGSSLTEIEMISRVLRGERSFEAHAHNHDLTFGARFAFHKHTDPQFAALLDKDGGVRVRFHGFAPGQSFGFVAPEGLELIADHTNDGTAKSLDGATVLVRRSVGNQTGYGATRGFLATRFTGDRAFVRNSGIRALVESMGQMGCNFMTGGRVSILGHPRHYFADETLSETQRQSAHDLFAHYRPPVDLRTDVVGANFGAGMSGGTVIMPRALYQEMARDNYLAESVRVFDPQPLSWQDVAELKADIDRFAAALALPSDDTFTLVDEDAEHEENARSADGEAIATVLAKLDAEAWERIAQQFVKITPTATDLYTFEFTSQESYTELASAAATIDLLDAQTGQRREGASVSILNDESEVAKEARRTAPTGTPTEKDACGTGIVVDLKHEASRDTVQRALTMLTRMMHRGARGIDPDSGDGCGVALFGTHEFFMEHFPDLALTADNFGVIAVALSPQMDVRTSAIAYLSEELAREGLEVAARRTVPTNTAYLGYIAQMTEPLIKHFIVLRPEGVSRPDFERKLTRVRLRFELEEQEKELAAARRLSTPEHHVAAEKNSTPADREDAEVAHGKQQQELMRSRAHVMSASSYYVVYKALCTEGKLAQYYYDDLARLTAKAAVSHSRFATNTLPAFKNVQPLPRFANNGENNSLERVRRTVEEEPSFAAALGLERVPSLEGYSDSSIMSIYMDCLFLMGADAKQIVGSTVLGYDPTGKNGSAQYFNLFALPFEGPNASIVYVEDKVVVVRDKNGFRPQRGVVDEGRWLYSGSELGTVAMEGRVFDLAPAEPMAIDLDVDGRPHQMLPPVDNGARKALEQLAQSHRRAGPGANVVEPIAFEAEDLQLRKRRAGWSGEVDERVMEPLFELGKGSTESMADQGPLEGLVRGSMFDLTNFFKGKFSQVTNPPLARNEEQPYMSTETHVGRKPDMRSVIISDGGTVPTPTGFFLPSPVVDNVQLATMVAHPSLNAVVVDTTFLVKERERGLVAAIERIRERCLEAVQQRDAHLIVLSDLATNEDRVGVPAVLASAVVDRALSIAGVRRDASIAVQAASVFSGVHISQAVSIGGADVVNPYLVFARDTAASEDEFFRTRTNYLKAVRQELLGFMARMGISSVSVYRGTKGFSAIGLDEEVARLYGVHSTLGGLSLQDVSRILYTNHRFILEDGLGKYMWMDQEPRKKIWNARHTNAYIKAARGDETLDEDKERHVNIIKSGWPRGWFKLRRPRVWTEENPLTVCILGGGAAGFYQAQELLQTDIPVHVVIIERQHVNKFGLLGDGIAPDHASTKRQGHILRELYSDPRVQYYGGIEVGTGRRVTVERLRAKYPVIVDCRGASEDVRLGIPGEHDSHGVMPASVVYRAYNNEFDPMERKDWPFMRKSKNPVLAIIGGGNVAADMARIFVKDPDELAETNINPVFLDYLRFEGPHVVRIFIRADPWKVKISLKELRELAETGVWMTAFFEPLRAPVNDKDTTLNPLDTLSESERALYDFFLAIRSRPRQERDVKRLYFHFQMSPKVFREIGNEVECDFEIRSTNEIVPYRASNYITALGKRKPEHSLLDVYTAGWSTGLGGTLALAEKSAQATTQAIVHDFYAGKFDAHTGDARKDESWQLRAVSNQDALSILGWLDEGRELRTVDDFHRAKQHKPFTEAREAAEAATDGESVASNTIAAAVQGSPDGVTIVDRSGHSTVLAVTPDTSVLDALKSQLPDRAPVHECDGELTCGTCYCKVITGNVERSRKEISLLKASSVSPKEYILTCAHKMDDLRNAVLGAQ